MSYKYKVKRKVGTINPEAEAKYYAVPHSSGRVSTAEVAKEIEAATTLTQSDVLGAIAALSKVIERKVSDGYSVKLDGLGVFSLSITSEGFTDAAKCTPHKVKAKKIYLRADSKLKEAIKDVKFERYVQPEIASLQPKGKKQ
ncbi:MAG: HU family DNA-binding protein [Bacteroidales bacterium]|jgi:predicted histone-like DNA-binding protein|nr:HU family DNA-binding protein [Bacteroidales bacterium]